MTGSAGEQRAEIERFSHAFFTAKSTFVLPLANGGRQRTISVQTGALVRLSAAVFSHRAA